MDYKVIGEGAYGCVHTPSLPCKNNLDINYNNYVSKLMTKKNALKELNEFLVISQLDNTNQYHLGKPILCEPLLTSPNVKKAIGKCKKMGSKDHSQLDLLVIKNGGYNLKEFCESGDLLSKYISVNPKEQVRKFWLGIANLFRGLNFFNKHGIVHYDLKPQNILFDPVKSKFVYIDFGLARKKSKIIEDSKKDDNFLGDFHWSYPLDNAFLNKSMFQKYTQIDDMRRFDKEFIAMFITYDNSNTFGLDIDNLNGFRSFFSYINLNRDDIGIHEKTKMIQSFLHTFHKEQHNEYNKFLNTVVSKIDIYGLGFTIKFVLNRFYSLKLVSDDFYNKVTNLCESMYDFDYNQRASSTQDLMHSYENILKTHFTTNNNNINKTRKQTPNPHFENLDPDKVIKRKYSFRKKH
jgi:serine/threonine protein kinase